MLSLSCFRGLFSFLSFLTLNSAFRFLISCDLIYKDELVWLISLPMLGIPFMQSMIIAVTPIMIP